MHFYSSSRNKYWHLHQTGQILFIYVSIWATYLLVDCRAPLLIFSHVLNLALFLVDRGAFILVDGLVDSRALLFVDGTALLFLQIKHNSIVSIIVWVFST